MIGKQDGQVNVRAKRPRLGGVGKPGEIVRKRPDRLEVARGSYKQVVIVGILERELAQDVAQVGADSEITRAANVEAFSS